MNYLFQHPMPVPWLVADVFALALTVLVVVFIVRTSPRPIPLLLEGVAFVFLYASVYENFAVVQGWYIYGRSLVMVGDVPLSVALIEFCVLTAALWTFGKMELPLWAGPIVAGMFGVLQDLSLDPISTQQVYTAQGLTSGRWSWLINADVVVNIHGIPVYNFSGWMLIIGYAASFLLLGRWWYERSGCRAWVGYVYPFAAMLAALLLLASPLSQLLLWFAPIATKGSPSEWVMLGCFFLLSLAVLVFAWRGRMKQRMTLRDDLPVFAVVWGLHLVDVTFVIVGGYWEVFPLVLGASIIGGGLLAANDAFSRKAPIAPTQYT